MTSKTVFEKLDLAPAYRQVSDSVEKMIRSGRLSLGDWLPPETELAAQLGVNRSTVREGLRGLEHAGLVRRDGKRLKVAIPHYTELASRASRALVMHQVTFRELSEAAAALETITAIFAAQRIDEGGIRALENNLKEMKARLNDIDSVVSLDIEFHNLLAEYADNRALSLAREPISLLFYPAGKIILTRLKTQKRILDAHKRIVALVRKHDEAGVRAWMERHMADLKRGYERTGIDMNRPMDSAV
ncbi:MAG: FadR family transcriptional regulator [Betaproteobacteria bacterium]|nr:FadR family transcriptional regulator [Betaproteobacteria bacterium]